MTGVNGENKNIAVEHILQVLFRCQNFALAYNEFNGINSVMCGYVHVTKIAEM